MIISAAAFLVQGSFKPLRHHCTEFILLIPCLTNLLTNFAFHLIASDSYKNPYLFPFLFPRPTSSLKKEKCCILKWKVSSSTIAWIKILLFSQLRFRKLNPFLIINCFKSLFICMFDYECGAAVTMDYTYVQVIKISHFYILKGG